MAQKNKYEEDSIISLDLRECIKNVQKMYKIIS